MSKSLFDLIKTLSKAEKRVFSERIKQTKRMHYYAKLITVYSTSEHYSSELDQKIFRKEDAKMMGDCKYKCKQLLCDYLVSLEKNKAIELQIEKKYNVALMLKNRKQYPEALKVLEKIDKLATQYELIYLSVRIKTALIRLAYASSGDIFEIDSTYIKSLFEAKKKVVRQLGEIEHALDKTRLALLNWHIKVGAVRNVPGTKVLPAHHFKNLRVDLADAQTRYYSFMGDKNYPKALDALKHVLSLTENNLEIVLGAELLNLSYAIYLRSYFEIEIGIGMGRKIDFPRILKKFDQISCDTIKKANELMDAKTIAYCLYSLHLNKPSLALPQIRAKEDFFQNSSFMEVTYNYNLKFCVMVYFAMSNWQMCRKYIEKVETYGVTKLTGSIVRNIKLISIYEQNDTHYFSSLIQSELTRRRKNKVKIKDCSDFNECVFNFLYYLDKDPHGDFTGQLRKILDNFDKMYAELRYIIHWIVYKIPALNNTDYQDFLKENNFEHYSFAPCSKKSLEADLQIGLVTL